MGKVVRAASPAALDARRLQMSEAACGKAAAGTQHTVDAHALFRPFRPAFCLPTPCCRGAGSTPNRRPAPEGPLRFATTVARARGSGCAAANRVQPGGRDCRLHRNLDRTKRVQAKRLDCPGSPVRLKT